jgi:hypothetical protein
MEVLDIDKYENRPCEVRKYLDNFGNNWEVVRLWKDGLPKTSRFFIKCGYHIFPENSMDPYVLAKCH